MVPTRSEKSKLELARREFADWFYSWSKKQSSDEFKKGFPLLGRIRAGSVLRSIEITESLSPAEGKRLVRLGIRRFHKEAATRANEAVTADEELWFNRYLSAHMIPSREEIRIRGWEEPQEHFWAMSDLAKLAYPSIMGHPLPHTAAPLNKPPSRDISKITPLNSLPKDELRRKQATVARDMSRFRIDRKALRNVVTDTLRKDLGVKNTKQTSREDLYEVPVGGWIISTFVDYGRGGLGGFQLRYFQGIRLSSGEPLTHHPTLAVKSTNWLGLGIPQWDLLTNDDLEEAAIVLSQLCTRFVEASSAILIQTSV